MRERRRGGADEGEARMGSGRGGSARAWGWTWAKVDPPNVHLLVPEGYLVSLDSLAQRVIIPKLNNGLRWKGLYAGRRGACTAIIEATNGSYAVAQAVLRHKTMDTTLRVYKKQITPQGLLAGMNQFQKSLVK
jgi:hypothetical protein